MIRGCSGRVSLALYLSWIVKKAPFLSFGASQSLLSKTDKKYITPPTPPSFPKKRNDTWVVPYKTPKSHKPAHPAERSNGGPPKFYPKSV